MANDRDPHWAEEVTRHEHPVKDKGIFGEDARSIAKYFASPKVSPRGIGQAVQKLTFYINRAGEHGNAAHIAKVRQAVSMLRKVEAKRKEEGKSPKREHEATAASKQEVQQLEAKIKEIAHKASQSLSFIHAQSELPFETTKRAGIIKAAKYLEEAAKHIQKLADASDRK